MICAIFRRFSHVFSTRPSGISRAWRKLTLRIFAASTASPARSSDVPRVPISPWVRSRIPVRCPRWAILSSVPPQVCSTSSRCAAMARTSSAGVSVILAHCYSKPEARYPSNPGPPVLHHFQGSLTLILVMSQTGCYSLVPRSPFYMPSPQQKIQTLTKDLAKAASRLKDEVSPKRVHHLRTTVRRIESLVGHFHHRLSKKQEKTLRELTALRQRAGKVRDLDVQAGLLSAIANGSSPSDPVPFGQALAPQPPRRPGRPVSAI